MILNGHIGQVTGPFEANKELLDDDGAIGIFTPEKEKPVLFKIGIQASQGTIVKINGVNVKIGATGIYELDDDVKITSVIFPSGAGNDALIDFIYAGDLRR